MAMYDGSVASASHFKAVNLTADIDFTNQGNQTPPRALFIGTAGDLVVRCGTDATTVKFTSLPSGFWLPIMPTHIIQSGTTATDIVALW